jgi:hypothetical protein
MNESIAFRNEMLRSTAKHKVHSSFNYLLAINLTNLIIIIQIRKNARRAQRP